MSGIGSSNKVEKPNKLLPHPSPKEPYKLLPARGSSAVKIDRRIKLAARADADDDRYVSTMYERTATWIRRTLVKV